MLSRAFDHFYKAVVEKWLGTRMRRGSLHAMKVYIEAVGAARTATLATYFLSLSAAILIAGMVLIVVGCVRLLPLDFTVSSLVMVGVGVLMSAAAGLNAYLFFKESRWLEISHANELLEAAMSSTSKEKFEAARPSLKPSPPLPN